MLCATVLWTQGMCFMGLPADACVCESLQRVLVDGCGWHVHDGRCFVVTTCMGIGYGLVRKSVEGVLFVPSPPDYPILPCRYCDVPDVMCDAAAVSCDAPCWVGCVWSVMDSQRYV
jgi:hypothetical protein